MKRFLLFGYADYYPSGGMQDFIKDFDTLEECHNFLERLPVDDIQDNNEIFDQQEGEVYDIGWKWNSDCTKKTFQYFDPILLKKHSWAMSFESS